MRAPFVIKDCLVYFLEEGDMKQVIAGIDEAGRGPLAGPVFAAAVILDSNQPILGLMDSKKLSEKKREMLYQVILNQSLAYGIGFATVEEIDEFNILQATFLAMRRAKAKLNISPDLVLVDGNQDPGLEACLTKTIIKGDVFIPCISAASILAKVSRDRYMLALHQDYPHYGFDRHKGYPTVLHKKAIKDFGLSPHHRKSFHF